METPLSVYTKALNNKQRSPEFVKSTSDYAANLEAHNLPIIFTPKHLSIHLGVEYNVLQEFSYNRSSHYHFFTIRKKSGGKRKIISPSHEVARWQHWIKSNILDKIPQVDCVMGFVRGKSIADNAKPHVGKQYILKMDIKDFFESIEEYFVVGVFKKIGYTTQVSKVLASICTVDLTEYVFEYRIPENLQPDFKTLLGKTAFLVQGASTSPSLANLRCQGMDANILRYADKKGFTYTRYADDLTFSADTFEKLPSVQIISRIVNRYHLTINQEKTSLMTHKGSQYVTGLLVDGRMRVPGWYKKDVSRHLHFCQKNGGLTHARKIAPNKNYYREWLMGRIYYINSIEPEVAQSMLKQADQIDWFR